MECKILRSPMISYQYRIASYFRIKIFAQVSKYGTDLMQRRTREYGTLEHGNSHARVSSKTVPSER